MNFCPLPGKSALRQKDDSRGGEGLCRRRARPEESVLGEVYHMNTSEKDSVVGAGRDIKKKKKKGEEVGAK